LLNESRIGFTMMRHCHLNSLGTAVTQHHRHHQYRRGRPTLTVNAGTGYSVCGDDVPYSKAITRPSGPTRW
jgi:hypothetical protein